MAKLAYSDRFVISALRELNYLFSQLYLSTISMNCLFVYLLLSIFVEFFEIVFPCVCSVLTGLVMGALHAQDIVGTHHRACFKCLDFQMFEPTTTECVSNVWRWTHHRVWFKHSSIQIWAKNWNISFLTNLRSFHVLLRRRRKDVVQSCLRSKILKLYLTLRILLENK